VKDWSIDDIRRLISEDAGFKITSIDTDKTLADDTVDGEAIINMINAAKEPGMNVIYISGDEFSAYTSIKPPKIEGTPGTIDDSDEFGASNLCGALIYYTGSASKEQLIEAFIVEVGTWGYGPDEWQDAITWH
jgi:hypothetical protein